MNGKILAGKTALVTGAGKGLGRAIVKAFSDSGANIIAVARTQKDLDSLTAEYENVEAWAMDVLSDDFITQVENLKTLDIVVNNAGGNRPEPMVEVSDENLDFMLDLNVRAVFRAARAGARVMTKNGDGGCIINMSSQMGHVGSPGRTVYCMSKHAVEGLTKAMAVELASDNIRVNSVAPTFVETPMTTKMFEDKAFKGFVDRMIPLGRLATAEQVASAALYLASPASSMITGHSLKIDGGWTAQ